MIQLTSFTLTLYFQASSKIDEFVKSNTDGARRKCPWGAK